MKIFYLELACQWYFLLYLFDLGISIINITKLFQSVISIRRSCGRSNLIKNFIDCLMDAWFWKPRNNLLGNMNCGEKRVITLKKEKERGNIEQLVITFKVQKFKLFIDALTFAQKSQIAQIQVWILFVGYYGLRWCKLSKMCREYFFKMLRLRMKYNTT